MVLVQLIGVLILLHFLLKAYSLLGRKRARRELLVESEEKEEANFTDPEKARMLGIFKESLVNPPQELKSPASLNSTTTPKPPRDILNHFMSSNPSSAFSMSFGNDALLAYSPSTPRRYVSMSM